MTDPTLTDAPPVAAPETAWARAERILSGDVRPDDYLPITPLIAERADIGFSWDRHKRLVRLLLETYHLEQFVAYIEDDNGVIVLETGLDEAAAMVRGLRQRPGQPSVIFGYIERPDVVYLSGIGLQYDYWPDAVDGSPTVE